MYSSRVTESPKKDIVALSEYFDAKKVPISELVSIRNTRALPIL